MEEQPRIGRKHFSLAGPPSVCSSRSSSPAPELDNHTNEESSFNGNGNENGSANGGAYYNYAYGQSLLSKEAMVFEDETPGRKPMDVYDATLPAWRAAIRRWLVERVKVESETIASMQERIRSPFLDAYFVYTSSLGTHTFFMILLPAFFFFGYMELGQQLITVLALGVYFSSVIKDLICSPRPFAPPVTRLTIGTHHLEYGFPSTHSTNSVSIALLFFSIIHELYSSPYPALSPQLFMFFSILLSIYAFSIVFGRIYTAMHSFTDCFMGIVLGTVLFWAFASWGGVPVSFSPSNPLSYVFALLGLGVESNKGVLVHLGHGLGLTNRLNAWVESAGWSVPVILIPTCLLLVNQHPQPVDDCPCFEDAIAFMSVVFGAFLGRWAVSTAVRKTVIMPGSGWILSQAGTWVQVERGWSDVALWWTTAISKMTVGILSIFIWRILAKSLLHLLLPPLFRLLAKAFELPNRRFYTPATEYKSVPSEFVGEGKNGGFGLHPIPSVIDLPGSVGGIGVEVGGIGSGVEGVEVFSEEREVKLRGSNGNGGAMHAGGREEKEKRVEFEVVESEAREDKNGRPVKHYDADVLTKVVVYAGIGFISCELMPMLFEYLGWGAQSWPKV